MRKYKIGFSKINHIFISHLHGDHIFGLIGLISTMELLGRVNDLHIFSHQTLQKFLAEQIQFLYANGISYNIIYHPLNYKAEELILDDKKVTVYSFPLSHRIPTCGFRFEEKPKLPNLLPEKIKQYNIPIRDRQRIKEGADFVTDNGQIIPHSELTLNTNKSKKFAFCSDTRFDESYIESVKNVDLLYHEATFADDNQKLASETFHSTGKDAANVAVKADVGKLIIGHFSARYKDHSVILNEAKAIFPNTEAITEGDVIQIEERLNWNL
jgi:ribonuclease Z